MKKKKKNYDQVVIKNEELVATTIGEINDKEGGIFFVLLIFGCLVVAAIFMPSITSFIDETFLHKEPSIENKPSTKPTTPSTTPEEKEEKIDYLAASSLVQATISGYRFEVSVQEGTKTLEASITNLSGSNIFFETNPYYFELYSSDKQLLQRVKIAKDEVVSTTKYSYDITTALNAAKVAYIAIVHKEQKDYPAILLNSIDNNNMPFLTCTKDNETLIYTFDKKDNTYLLTKIKDRYSIKEKDEETITTYEGLVNTYSSVDGVEADITPTTSGFAFDTTIDLTKVVVKDKKRILSNPAYYEKNTEARAVAFELNSSGYMCK